MPHVEASQVATFLRERLIQRTGIQDAELEDDTPLSEVGVTSLDAVLISGELEERFDIDVDPTMMFEHRTIRAVAENVAALTVGK